MKSSTDFLPRILPYVPGCNIPMAQQALNDAAIAFCEDSLVLREQIAPIQTVANQSAYDLSVTDLQVCRIMELWVDGIQIEPFPREVADNLPTNSIDVATGMPRGFYTTRAGSTFQVVLYPTPDKVYTLRAEVATRPARDLDVYEDDLFDFWVEPVVAGTLSRLKAIPGQSFSDPAGAFSLMSSATAMSRRARIEGSYGRIKGTTRVRPRSFTRGKP